VDEPPGIHAFSLRPFHTPPASSSSTVRAGMPSGTSYTPGFSTWPEMPTRMLPGLFAVPSA
jgi:hypothetical protein